MSQNELAISTKIALGFKLEPLKEGYIKLKILNALNV